MGSCSKTGMHHQAGSAHYRAHGFTQAPLVVQWMATLRCELACPHCLAAGEDGPGDDMSLADALDLVDQVAELGVEELLVTGGEPLLREDLPQIIDRLHSCNQTWSLNTAVMPSGAIREAIEAYPPAFVAVSLDGPRGLHDSFRGVAGSYEQALESLQYFSSLPGVSTAAGTTVTAANFDSLELTRLIVQACGVGHWGIHLLVPEGRAAARPELELTRSQKRRLLADMARWRQHMPVSLADEIGYCGPGEAMLRNEPFACGAGRTQCVVLPDGHVVPCNTLDVTTAAGNLHERSLAGIWANGFGQLRSYRPEGTCRSCPDAAACGGGCWLHRRAGTQCSRDVWTGAAWAKTAATVTACLAGLGPAIAPAQSPAPPRPTDRAQQVDDKAETVDLAAAEAWILRVRVARAHASLTDRARNAHRAQALEQVPQERTDQPVWKLIDLWQRSRLPEQLEDRLELVETVLKSDCQNLAVLGLAMQTVVEPIIGGAWPAEQRSVQQRSRLAKIFDVLHTQTLQAQGEYIAAAVERYKAGQGLPFRPMSKVVRPGEMLEFNMVHQRLGLQGADRQQVLDALAKSKFDPLWARAMQIRVESVDDNVLLHIQPGQSHGKGTDMRVGPFDAIDSRVQDAPVKVRLSWPQEQNGESWTLELPAGRTLHWADLLALFGRTHGPEVHKQLLPQILGSTGPARRLPSNPLLLPVMRELPDALSAGPEISRHVQGSSPKARAAVLHWLADFWTF
ncbi:MAG: radical SAM protein [Phycisphaerae bacterium]